MTHNSEWLQRGQGTQTLVFLHYFGGAAESWQWVFDELAQDYACVAVNLPGFGGAHPLAEPNLAFMAQRVQRLLTSRLGLRRFSLIGHGFGASVALHLAGAPTCGLIDNLILIAPSVPAGKTPGEVFASRPMGRLDAQEAESSAKEACRLPLSAEQMATAVETQLEADVGTCRWWQQHANGQFTVDLVSNARVTLSVLSGRQDPVVALETLRSELLAHMPQAVLSLHPESGHLILLEDPQWVAQRVRAIVR